MKQNHLMEIILQDEGILHEDIVEEIPMLIERIIPEQERTGENEMELLEEWLEEDPNGEYCMEDISIIQNDFIELYEELNFLEEIIIIQTHILQHVKL